MQWSWIFRTAPIIAGALFIAWMFWVRFPVDGAAPADARFLYSHAELIRAGEALYWPWPDFGPHYMTGTQGYPVGRLPYPPFLTVLLSRITGAGELFFYRAWFILLFAAFWFYAAMLARLATCRVELRGILIAATCLAVYPGTWAPYNTGNVDPILWGLIALGVSVPAMRGFGFMTPALIKLYGVWPLLVAARIEGRRVLVQASSVLVASVLISAAIIGPLTFLTASIDWFRWMLPTAGQGTWHHWNVSLSFLGLRVTEAAGLWNYVEGPLPSAARWYLVVAGVGAPILTMWFTRRLIPELRYSLVTCAAVLFSPLCWIGYTPLLYTPAALLVRSRGASPFRTDAESGDRATMAPT